MRSGAQIFEFLQVHVRHPPPTYSAHIACANRLPKNLVGFSSVRCFVRRVRASSFRQLRVRDFTKLMTSPVFGVTAAERAAKGGAAAAGAGGGGLTLRDYQLEVCVGGAGGTPAWSGWGGEGREGGKLTRRCSVCASMGESRGGGLKRPLGAGVEMRATCCAVRA